MRVDPVVFGDPQDLTMDGDDMHDALTFIRNGSADTLAMGMEETLDRKANFSFSIPLYKVILIELFYCINFKKLFQKFYFKMHIK